MTTKTRQRNLSRIAAIKDNTVFQFRAELDFVYPEGSDGFRSLDEIASRLNRDKFSLLDMLRAMEKRGMCERKNRSFRWRSKLAINTTL